MQPQAPKKSCQCCGNVPVQQPAVPEGSSDPSSAAEQRVSQKSSKGGSNDYNEFSQIQPHLQQIRLRTAQASPPNVPFQENISPNAFTRRMFETGPRGGRTNANEVLSDMIQRRDVDMKVEQPLEVGEDFADPLPEMASLEQTEPQPDGDYVMAQDSGQPFGNLIRPQSVPYREHTPIVENPEVTNMQVAQCHRCDQTPPAQIAAVSMQSAQGSGPQTPPEQRVSQRTTSSDNLRCREDYPLVPGQTVREEQLMPPPPPPAATFQRATATSVFEQLPQHRSASPQKQPRSPHLIERQSIPQFAGESFAGLSPPNQIAVASKIATEDDNIFGQAADDGLELPYADSGGKRAELLKLPVRSHSSQVNLSPGVDRMSSFQRRRNVDLMRQSRGGPTTFADNDMIMLQNDAANGVSNQPVDHEAAENFGLIKSRASRRLKSSAYNESPFAQLNSKSKRQLDRAMSQRQFSAVTPDKKRGRVPFQNMQIKQLTNGLQLEFNWKINIHSLSHNRSRKGVDRDSSLTSGRKKSDQEGRRSKAAACDIRGFSTSKKLRSRRQRRDEDDEQGVSPVKSFALDAAHESAANSPAAPMVAKSQFLSSSSKRSRRVPHYMLPYLPPVQGAEGKQRTPVKDLPYPQVLGDTLTVPDIHAWQKALYRANHQAMAASAQLYQQCQGLAGSGRKDVTHSPSNLTQTNGVKMEGGRGASQRKDTSTSGKRSLAVPSSHDSEDAEGQESELESNEFGQVPYPYPPYFMPWFYPFFTAQGVMPIRFQQEYGAFVAQPAPNSSQSSKPFVNGGAREDEIISAASPDRLARSIVNGRASERDRDFTTSRKQRSGVAASDAPEASQGKIVGMECSPAHTGRLYGRQNMPSVTAAEASQNSQLSNEQPYFPLPQQWAQASMPIGQGLQPSMGYLLPIQGAKWPGAGLEPAAEIEPDLTKKGDQLTESPINVQQQENPESVKAADANQKSNSRNSGTRNAKRDRPAASPNPPEQNSVVLADTTVSKPASKKKRVAKASKKAGSSSKQLTPTKSNKRHAATVKKQKSGGDGDPHENTFDRPDDVNFTTNAKQARRQAKDSGTLFPMTPLKAECKVGCCSGKDIAQGSVSLPPPSEDTPMPSQVRDPSLTNQLEWINTELDEQVVLPQNDDAAAERSEGENAPKRRRRKNYDSALLSGPARISGVQREELNKMNERKLEDQLERVLRQTLTQEELFAKIEAGQPTVTKCKGCKCRKGLCLKRYCECLRNNATCGSQCGCHKYFRCNNLPTAPGTEGYETRKAAIAEILKRKPDAFEPKVDGSNTHTQGCNCKNSKCQKAYCECFERGVLCTDKCKCVDCRNCEKHGARPRERPEVQNIQRPEEQQIVQPHFVVGHAEPIVLEAPPYEQMMDVDAGANELDLDEYDDDADKPELLGGQPEISVLGTDLVCIEALHPPPIADKRKRRGKKDGQKPTAGQAENEDPEGTAEKSKKRRPVFDKVVTRSMRKKTSNQ